jgi:hypothetical protein
MLKNTKLAEVPPKPARFWRPTCKKVAAIPGPA